MEGGPAVTAPRNLLTDLPSEIPAELTETIWQAGALHIERIVSMGHASPPGFWYDQDADEWVLLLAGAAGLRIEGREEVLALKPGDHVLLPAHQRHRVEWTASDWPTVWLAVHGKPG
jgi:cupin 2 domain-containing protein